MTRFETNPPRVLTLAVTGASGSALGVEMVRALAADSRVHRVHLVISPSALRVMAEEIGPISRNSLIDKLVSEGSKKVVQHAHEDIGAPIASGSYPVDAMVVLPCSMGTLAGIAHGMAGNLVERAADVCLKERRRLVLCVRETPLNLIHIRNMAAVTEAGATVFPVIPTFYNQPKTMEDMARSFVHRVLQHIGLPQPDAFVWGGEPKP
ncbi:MAG TPA: UbiX family flavin prenyltransferase [Candidatus Aquilonibacter sp.]|nr:UbiX family flavin prenyltransferase [Candidatus Aquilonibacter sp.]